ncbi:MAG: hypothetical protein ACOX6U_01345 [Oscillospiraceae bacterium]|jgi:hypothetical protein
MSGPGLPSLAVYGVDYHGVGSNLGTPFSLSFHSVLTQPYDELTVWVKGAANQFYSLCLTLDGQTFFDGLVLSQQREKTLDGDRLKLVCRSKPGYLMTENQLNPYAYFQVTGEAAVQTYAVPCGIAGLRVDESKTVARMLVSERQSYWDYLTVFFMRAYGKLPYVARDNYIELTPYSGRSLMISNRQADGLAYLDFADHFKVRMVSSVWFYTGSDDLGDLYEESYSNAVAADYGAKKELYVNPTRAWVLDHARYADYLFYKSMVDSRAIEVTMAGMPDIHKGDSVVFDRGSTMTGNLYVGEKRIETTEQGVTTTVWLWDKQFHKL